MREAARTPPEGPFGVTTSRRSWPRRSRTTPNGPQRMECAATPGPAPRRRRAGTGDRLARAASVRRRDTMADPSHRDRRTPEPVVPALPVRYLVPAPVPASVSGKFFVDTGNALVRACSLVSPHGRRWPCRWRRGTTGGRRDADRRDPCRRADAHGPAMAGGRHRPGAHHERHTTHYHAFPALAETDLLQQKRRRTRAHSTFDETNTVFERGASITR